MSGLGPAFARRRRGPTGTRHSTELTSFPPLFFFSPTLSLPGAGAPRVVCRACGSSAAVRRVALPYVFRFLATELAAMNIKTTLAVSA